MLTTAEELREFKRCAASFPHFLREHVWIRDAGGSRFLPWSFQLRLARVWLTQRRVIILKGRQLGISWLAAAYALWTAMFHPGALVLLVSQTKTDAQELLAKVKFIFDRLPEWLRPEVGRDNTLVLEFPELSSGVEALPSTEKAGRGRTAALVIADEHAFHQWGEVNFTALGPTMDAGGQFISLSTANGIGNFYADLWAKAGHPKSRWHQVFLPYSLRPGRDEAWYEAKALEYTRPWMIHQEYPRDAEEAFVQTGRPVFAAEVVRKQKALCTDALPKEQWPEAFLGWDTDELRVFEPPQRGHRYVAGADVAEGLEHGDYSDLTIWNADAPGGPREALSLHGHWDVDVFGRLIDQVARVYPGLYGIERNNHGLTVLVTCRNLGTPGLYREQPVLTKQGVEIESGKLGWFTDIRTKPLMIDELAQALRDFAIKLSDALAIPELTFYQTLKDGKTGAPSGQWDDRVMSRAIAAQMLKRVPARISHDFDDDGPSGTFAARSW